MVLAQYSALAYGERSDPLVISLPRCGVLVVERQEVLS
jgi:hypothetical protein